MCDVTENRVEKNGGKAPRPCRPHSPFYNGLKMSTRQSLPRRAKSCTTYAPSLLQRQLDRAINSPGGVHKTFTLLQKASTDEINILNEHKWSPLVGVIFRLGKNTTRKGNNVQSEIELINLIKLCHERGLDLNSGGYFGEHFHRPLTIASYYGFHNGVQKMIELGALPDLTDGEGKTAWHTAFDNPCGSLSGKFRDCDRRTASALLEMGAVTSNLDEWRERTACALAGALCYVNVESEYGSPLYRAVMNKRYEVVKFIVESGGSISDREFLRFHFQGKLRLLYRIADMLLESARNNIVGQETTVDEKYINWSYPPTWKQGVEIGVIEWDKSGLPSDMFQSKVVPFLGRDWFFMEEQLTPAKVGVITSNLPPRQIASGEGL